MISLGFTGDYSDAVIVGTAFQAKDGNNVAIVNYATVSTYLIVSVAGDIIYVDRFGYNQWIPSVPVGYVPIAATKILAGPVTVNGQSRTTTATVSSWIATGR